MRTTEMRFINLKMDTGFSILEAKSDRGSKGCILNAMPIILLEAIVKHIEEIIRFKKEEKSENN